MNNFERDNYIIYKNGDLLDFAKCPIRGEIELPSYKPEEKIRLSFIHFIVGCSEIYPELIDILVEKDRLDISIINRTLGDIFHYLPPVLIIETKREEYNLINAYQQLIEYLDTSKVENGLLFNFTQTYKITKHINNYECNEIFEPSEIINFIFTSITNQNNQYAEEKTLFIMAKNGNFDAFKILALKYRRNKRIIFKINQMGNEYLIEGHLFDFDTNEIKYTKCGYDSKSENRPSFLMNEFINLERIQKY